MSRAALRMRPAFLAMLVSLALCPFRIAVAAVADAPPDSSGVHGFGLVSRPQPAAWTAPRPDVGTGRGHLFRTTAILAVGGLAAIWAHDGESPDQAVRALDRSGLESASDIGNLYGSGWVIGSSSLWILALGRATGSSSAAALGGDLCESFLLSSAVSGVIKYGINRTRPTGGGHSFPSGHTTVAFSVVPVLGHFSGWKGALPGTILALATGMGRMEDRHHFFSDVVFGAAIGLACGDLVAGEGFLPGGAHLAASPWGFGISLPF